MARRRLTPKEDLAICILYHAGCGTHRSLAELFGVSSGAIEIRVNPRAREKARERAREWGRKHPERVAARHKAWRKANPERERENFRKWRQQNQEKFAATQKRWNEKNPDSARTRWTNRRARERAAFVEYVRSDVVWQRDGGICGICGKPADPDNWHMDHIKPLAKGGEHSYANVQVSHPSCNVRKWTHELPRAA